MTTHTPTPDVIDQLSGIAPGHPLDAIRAGRAQARIHSQQSYLALFEPRLLAAGDFTLEERFAIATFVTAVQGQAQATLEGAADAAALSQFHLIRLFRAVYGETPLAWSCGRRLEVARDALLMTDDSIEAIAHRAGYESRTAFDRAFRRRFGEPPGALRTRR